MKKALPDLAGLCPRPAQPSEPQCPKCGSEGKWGSLAGDRGKGDAADKDHCQRPLELTRM